MASHKFVTLMTTVVALASLAGCGKLPAVAPAPVAAMDMTSNLPMPELSVFGKHEDEGITTVDSEIGKVTLGLIPDGHIPADTPVYEKLAGKDRKLMSQALPKAVDLREFVADVRNQGNLGSCTSFSSSALLEFYFRKKGQTTPRMSPLFIYYTERSIMDAGQRSRGEKARALGMDTGGSSYLACYALTHFGACPESDMPYQDGKAALKVAPSEKAQADAQKYRPTTMAQIKTIDGMKKALSDGHAFILGMKIYKSFMTKAVARTGKMLTLGDREESVGGHSVMCVGYDDAKGAFIIRNSWGKDWGQDGYFEMPYEYVKPGKMYSCFTIL
ncbi:MAG: peptidase [Cyanobacteria bacterium RYN_339]|nr:peptidase [Cyanobacteria bacterium RYN_339]